MPPPRSPPPIDALVHSFEGTVDGLIANGTQGGASPSQETSAAAAHVVEIVSTFLDASPEVTPQLAQAVTTFISGVIEPEGQLGEAPAADSDSLSSSAVVAIHNVLRQLTRAVPATGDRLTLTSDNLNVTVTSRSAANLKASPVSCSTATTSAVASFGDSVLQAAEGVDASLPVSVLLFSSSQQFYESRPVIGREQGRSGLVAATPTRVTPLVSLSLVQGGVELHVDDAASPVNLSMPLVAAAEQSQWCLGLPQTAGEAASCSSAAQCMWWDGADWSSIGCETVRARDGGVTCSCDHLTDFVVFEFPVTWEDAAADVERGFMVNALSADAFSCVVQPLQNHIPLVWSIDGALLLLAAALLAYAIARDHAEIVAVEKLVAGRRLEQQNKTALRVVAAFARTPAKRAETTVRTPATRPLRSANKLAAAAGSLGRAQPTLWSRVQTNIETCSELADQGVAYGARSANKAVAARLSTEDGSSGAIPTLSSELNATTAGLAAAAVTPLCRSSLANSMDPVGVCGRGSMRDSISSDISHIDLSLDRAECLSEIGTRSPSRTGSPPERRFQRTPRPSLFGSPKELHTEVATSEGLVSLENIAPVDHEGLLPVDSSIRPTAEVAGYATMFPDQGEDASNAIISKRWSGSKLLVLRPGSIACKDRDVARQAMALLNRDPNAEQARSERAHRQCSSVARHCEGSGSLPVAGTRSLPHPQPGATRSRRSSQSPVRPCVLREPVPMLSLTPSQRKRAQQHWDRVRKAAKQAVIARRWYKGVDHPCKRLLLACRTSHTLVAGMVYRGFTGFTRAQTCMILLNSLVLELVVVCLFYSSDSGGPVVINPVRIVATGTLVALVSIPATALFAWLFLPAIFAATMRRARSRASRLVRCLACVRNGALPQGLPGRAVIHPAGSLATGDAFVAMALPDPAAAQPADAAHYSFASLNNHLLRRSLRRSLQRRDWFAVGEILAGWAANLLLFFGMLLLFTLYGCEFYSAVAGQAGAAEVLLLTWAMSMFQRWAVNEPTIIIMAKGMPMLFASEWCRNVCCESCVNLLQLLTEVLCGVVRSAQ